MCLRFSARGVLFAARRVFPQAVKLLTSRTDNSELGSGGTPSARSTPTHCARGSSADLARRTPSSVVLILYLDVSRMKHRQVGDLLEIVLLIKGQDLGNAVVLHNHTVNHVARSEEHTSELQSLRHL